MKAYTTAINEKAAEGTESEDVVRFPIDGREVTAFKPDDALIAIIISRTGSRATVGEVGGAVIDFLLATLDKKDARWVEDRLFDREDPFGLAEVLEITFDLIEEWTGRPTVRLSVS